ncbi:metal cation symporter ZIP14-like [Ptychodera flava]|uniref:metal cation symporter ZIP14-like n=1 Tax=Ptychodera flava TaxID=63121 RepID=UPI00396A231E
MLNIARRKHKPKTLSIAMMSYRCLALVFLSSSVLSSTVWKSDDASRGHDTALSMESDLTLSEAFLDYLVHEYGTNGKLSGRELGNLLVSLKSGGADLQLNGGFADYDGGKETDRGEIGLIKSTEPPADSKDLREYGSPAESNSLLLGIQKNPTGSGIRNRIRSGIETIQDATSDDAEEDETGDEKDMDDGLLFEGIWLHRIARSADHEDHHGEQNLTHLTPPTKAETWGYGFLCVTVISACSLLGAFVIPLIRKQFFQSLLMFLICLAVGSLSGGALMHLIPEATGNHPELTERLKSLVVIGGIYLFFLTERFINIMTMRRKRRSQGKATAGESTDILTLHSVTIKDDHSQRERILQPAKEAAYGNPGYQDDHEITSGDNSKGTLVVESSLQNEQVVQANVENNNTVKSEHPVHVHGHKGHAHTELATDDGIASVAYMIILGDGLHNFIDGLAIGAAFSVAVVRGISICIAIICEEFPHELGDFAILLNAGMPVKRALFLNFLSACMCYLGLVFGVLLSELAQGASWIFAIAGGMFLYISLVDMLPEINTAEEKEKDVTSASQAKTFILQNLGLLTGWGIMFVLGVYEHELNNLLQ